MEATATKSTFPKYPAYKDSGSDWSGKMPAEWNALPIRAIFEERNEKNNGPKTDFILSVTKNRGVIPYDEKGQIGNNKSEDIERYKVVYPNDFVINKMNVIIGSLGMSKYHGAFSQVYLVYKPKSSKINIEYYSYIFSNPSFFKSLIRFCTGIMELRESLNKNDFKKIILPFPDFKTQSNIVKFLDKKTAKIDRAIAQKEKLIELLKERKQIIIQNAVTKGLDPNVKMKESGVEWIGEIPEHWEVTKFKNQIKLRHGHQFLDHDFTEEGIEVVKITQLHKNGYLDLSKATKVSYHLLKKYNDILIKKGDVLMCLTGGTIGKIIRVGAIDRPLLQNYRVGHFSSAKSEQIDNDYIFYLMSSEMLQAQIYLDLGETGQPNIGMEDMKNMIICVPTKDEQRKIVTYLERQIQKTDSIISLQQTQIEKLKEYKATLIDSAVTGKLRVPSVQEIKVC